MSQKNDNGNEENQKKKGSNDKEGRMKGKAEVKDASTYYIDSKTFCMPLLETRGRATIVSSTRDHSWK